LSAGECAAVAVAIEVAVAVSHTYII